MNRRVSKALTKYTQDKYSPYAEVYMNITDHNQAGGWWLKTETESIFLAIDFKAAKKELDKICLLKD